MMYVTAGVCSIAWRMCASAIEPFWPHPTPGHVHTMYATTRAVFTPLGKTCYERRWDDLSAPSLCIYMIWIDMLCDMIMITASSSFSLKEAQSQGRMPWVAYRRDQFYALDFLFKLTQCVEIEAIPWESAPMDTGVAIQSHAQQGN